VGGPSPALHAVARFSPWHAVWLVLQLRKRFVPPRVILTLLFFRALPKAPPPISHKHTAGERTIHALHNEWEETVGAPELTVLPCQKRAGEWEEQAAPSAQRALQCTPSQVAHTIRQRVGRRFQCCVFSSVWRLPVWCSSPLCESVAMVGGPGHTRHATQEGHSPPCCSTRHGRDPSPTIESERRLCRARAQLLR